MAGDWIKMRSNLWDDPRIARLCDLTDQSEAAVVGGLYWLWAAADQHSEDGVMPGLSITGINRKTGIKGFGEGLVSVGWIADHPEGIRIVRFDEHNGSSAKKRCETAKRVATHRSKDLPSENTPCNANVVTESVHKQHTSVSSALAREREREREREDIKEELPTHTENNLAIPTQAGAVCVLLKSKGFSSVNPGHQGLIDLLNAGATIGAFDAAADIAKTKKKDFAYILGIVRGQMQDAQGMAAQARASPVGKTETAYQRSMREKWEEATGKRSSQESNIIDITPIQNQARIA